MYLANHCPSLPGHPRRYTFRGRGHSFCFFRFLKPVLAVTTPFYEKDIAVQDVRFANNLIALFGEIVKRKRTLPQRYWNCRNGDPASRFILGSCKGTAKRKVLSR